MQIKQTTTLTSPIYQDALAIRKAVFIDEQKVPQSWEIEHEAGPIYFVGYLDAKPAVCARALLENENTWHIQRVACLKEFRRQGLAKKLLQYIEHKAKENKLAYLTLGAQDQAQGFYLSLGYHVVGAGFLDAGINHHRMDKKI